MAIKEFIKELKDNHISMVKRNKYTKEMKRKGQCVVNGYTYVIC